MLVGESGSGKSTLLRLVAGIIEPDAGRIVLDEVVLSDSETRQFVAPESRSVGYLPQDLALFPHLDAFGNIAFGLRASGVGAREVRDRTRQISERFELSALLDRRPAQLSGGQQQRVALARALILDPAVLLLDEPLSALDVGTRRTVRGELKRVLDGLACVTLLVTHHPAEALALGHRIAVFEGGRITQTGTREAFVRHPRSQYVAAFLGVNLFSGELTHSNPDGLATVNLGDSTLTVPDPGRTGRVQLVVHPHDIVLSVTPPVGSARNIMEGAVTELIPEPPKGDRVRVMLDSRPPLAAQVTASAIAELGLRPGVHAFASFKATGVEVLPEP